MIGGEIAQGTFVLLTLLAIAYYVNLLASKPDPDESRTIRVYGWHLLSPSPARVGTTVQHIVTQLLVSHLGYSVTIDRSLLRAFHEYDIVPIRIRQARRLRYVRIIAGMLLTASVLSLLMVALSTLGMPIVPRIAAVAFVVAAIYDFYVSLRLDWYIAEHENA